VRTSGKNLLLFDDLYRSGATVSAITELLKSQGKAKAVYLLTLTETRRTA
jgi:predicted amidophosphoribosyltransferase